MIVAILAFVCINNNNRKQASGITTPKDLLRKLKLESPHKIIIGHLNINSIRNKFECLKEICEDSIDVLLLSETKLNDTFPTGQFTINRFHTPFRKDRCDKGGGLLTYIREHLPCRRIKVEFTPEIEAIVIEINLKMRKWLLIGTQRHDCSSSKQYWKTL